MVAHSSGGDPATHPRATRAGADTLSVSECLSEWFVIDSTPVMADTELRGVCPIIDTPFTGNGDVDYESLEHLVDALATNGCHALALFGYASEFYKLDREERDRMAELVVDRCDAHGVPSVVSVTAQSTDVAIEEARRYEDLGADALMVLPPHVRDPPVGKVVEHLRTLGETVSLPVMVQYAPGSTNSTIPVDALVELYNTTQRIEYFKIECEPPGGYIEDLQSGTDGNAKVFVGRAGYELIEALDRDCVGVMPASAMYDIYLDIYEHYRAGRRGEAIDLHTELLGVLNQLTKVGIQFEKRILAKRGLVESDHCRAPESEGAPVNTDLIDEYYERYVQPNIS